MALLKICASAQTSMGQIRMRCWRRTEGRRKIGACRMARLKGSEAQKVSLIREKMIESKIEMLNEILAHPYCPDYLCCSRGFIDYETPISAAISAILLYPQATATRT